MAIASHAHHVHADGDANVAQEIGVRTLKIADLLDALKLGLDDFRAKPSHLFVLGLVYVAGAVIAAGVALDLDFTHLLFPIASGFALTGPFAAIVLYEISRRREQGLDFAWNESWKIFTHASFGAIAILGLFLFLGFASSPG